MQQWCARSVPAMEDALYEIEPMRHFAGAGVERGRDSGRVDVPSLSKAARPGGEDPRAVNAHFGQQGLLLRQGTIVDATTIQAPSWTNNRDKQRDSEMHQTKKRQQRLKAHTGMDVGSGWISKR